MQFSRSRATSALSAAVAAALFLGTSTSAQAQVASAHVREGESVAAGSTVSGIDSPSSNGVGGWAFGTTNTDAVDRFFGTASGAGAAVLRSEGTFGQYVQTAFEGFFGIADSGAISYGPTISDTSTGATGLDSVWLDDAKVLNEGDPIPSLPGMFSVFNSDPQITYNGVPYWVGGYGPGTTTTDRALFFGTTATPVLKTGDAVGNSGGQSVAAAGPGFGSRFSGQGTNYIATPTLTGGTVNDSAVVVNGSVLDAGGPVREGFAVGAPGGLPGELWAFFDTVAVTEAGHTFVTGDTNAATTTDEFVMVNGAIVLREGAVLSTTLGPATISGAIEWGDMNESQDWAVTWDVTDGGGINREALIINGAVALLEGDLVDWNGDGVINASDNNGKLADFTGIRSFSVGERQLDGTGTPFFDVFFTADIDFFGTSSSTDDLEGGFSYRVVIPEPASLSLLAGAAALVMRPRRRRR